MINAINISPVTATICSYDLIRLSLSSPEQFRGEEEDRRLRGHTLEEVVQFWPSQETLGRWQKKSLGLIKIRFVV